VARVNARCPGRGVEPRISQEAAAEARCAKNNEGADDDETATKGGDETNDKHLKGVGGGTGYGRNTGVQGAESRIWWASGQQSLSAPSCLAA
jgi:hypothetical protein